LREAPIRREHLHASSWLGRDEVKLYVVLIDMLTVLSISIIAGVLGALTGLGGGSITIPVPGWFSNNL
jgi:hypothetical protein